MRKIENENVKHYVQIIAAAYSALDKFSEQAWIDRRAEVLADNVKAEKMHRRINPGSYRLTVSQAAKLHVVKWIAHALRDPAVFTLRDLMVCQIGVLKAYAFGLHHEKYIRDAWKDFDIEVLTNLDYAAIV